MNKKWRGLVLTHTLGHWTNNNHFRLIFSFAKQKPTCDTPVKITASAFLSILSRVVQDVRTLNAHIKTPIHNKIK